MRISTDQAHRASPGFLARSASLGVALLLSSLAVTGCKKEEAPPPLPAAEPAPVATAEPLKLEEEEDAGLPKEEVKKPTGKAPAASNLTACCSALRQNAASAPKPTSDYMLQAAAMCDALAAQGKDKSTMIAALTAALRGANLPSGCR